MTHPLEEVVRSYEVLGIEVGAPPEKAKDAYRKLIKVWHPDTFEGDPEEAEQKTKSLILAFTRVKSLKAKELRDVRTFYRASQAIARRPARRGFWSPRRRPARKPRRRTAAPRSLFLNRCGRDIVVGTSHLRRRIRWGGRWKLVLPTCRACGGWGASLEVDAGLEVCPACDGKGLLGLSPTMDQPLSLCGLCRGYGATFEKSCQVCRGTGRSSEYSVYCSLPRGIDHDTYGLLAGRGHPGIGRGHPGDLYVVLYLS